MKKSTLQKLSLLHAWQLPLKERLTRLLIPTHSKDGKPFFQGLAFAQNDCLVHVNTTNYIVYKIFAEGGYEVYLTNLIKHFLIPNSTFLDIGANIGIHSLGVATQPNVKIYAFEPIDFIREKLSKNIALNNYSNITIVPLALSNENKAIKTNFGSDSSNQGTFSIQNEAEGVNEIKCKIGDDFVTENNISTISVIKIDVEGFEMHVLQGLKQTKRNQKPVIFFEFDTNYIHRANSTTQDFDHYFQTMGYQLFAIEKSILIPFQTLSEIKGMKEICARPF